MLPWLQRWRGWGCKLWEHTCCCSLVALTAIWRWHSSTHHTLNSLCSCHAAYCVHHHDHNANSPVFIHSPVVPNEQLWFVHLSHCWQTNPTSAFFCLFVCFFFKTLLCSHKAPQQVIHPLHSTSALCWHPIDHPSPHCPPPAPPPQTCQQHVSWALPRCLTVPLPPDDLLYYYTSWQWVLVSV